MAAGITTLTKATDAGSPLFNLNLMASRMRNKGIMAIAEAMTQGGMTRLQKLNLSSALQLPSHTRAVLLPRVVGRATCHRACRVCCVHDACVSLTLSHVVLVVLGSQQHTAEGHGDTVQDAGVQATPGVAGPGPVIQRLWGSGHGAAVRGHCRGRVPSAGEAQDCLCVVNRSLAQAGAACFPDAMLCGV